MLLAAGRLRRGPQFYPGAEPRNPTIGGADRRFSIPWLLGFRLCGRRTVLAAALNLHPGGRAPRNPTPRYRPAVQYPLGRLASVLTAGRRAVLVDADSPSRGLRSVWHPP